MASPAIELADIVWSHGREYFETFPASALQRRILTAIASCRTPALGAHVSECDACGHRHIAYHSCRDRHCPKCQSQVGAQWFEARAADLLQVGYFHLVFTLPEELRALALQNKKPLYDLLFQSAANSLLELARDPKHLGAHIGFHAILHTWSQTLRHHPHVHCVVPGGGLAQDDSHWVASRKNFFLPVRVLRDLFRGKFLHGLNLLFERGRLQFHGRLAPLGDSDTFDRLSASLRKKKWVVYAKPPFAGPETVLKYLARYTHRVAISNSRILALENGNVTFSFKDYRDHSRRKIMTLPAVHFLRRFLLHVLPRNFVRIRHYGFLANRVRNSKIALCRNLLPRPPASSPPPEPAEVPAHAFSEGPRCPVCKRGTLVVVDDLPPSPRWILRFCATRGPP